MEEKGFYNELLERVERGARFRIDLPKRRLFINGKEVELPEDLGVPPIETDDDSSGTETGIVAEVLRRLEGCFFLYEHSIPSERSGKRHGTYYAALPESKLSRNDMLYGEDREYARFRLEFLTLAYIRMGLLTWQPEWGTWFYKSPTSNMRIKRSWVEPAQR